jgi:HAD superfamily hydrolase (TIGR01509 family)
MTTFERPDEGSYAAVIFDCDGTLADSMPLHYRSWVEAFQKHSAPFEFSEKRFHELGGTGLVETVEILNQEHGAELDPEAVVAAKESWYQENLTQVGPVADVVAFARELAGRGLPIAVASGSPTETLRRTLEIIKVAKLFPVVISRDDVEEGKPAPDSFLKAAKALRIQPSDTIVLEDSPLGLEAARRAGMRGILVKTAPEAEAPATG